MTERYTCPVCGFPHLFKEPRTQNGGSYEICWSCGFEFGVTDDDLGYSYDAWRQLWIARGMPWDSARLRPEPEGWDPVQQLKSVASASLHGPRPPRDGRRD